MIEAPEQVAPAPPSAAPRDLLPHAILVGLCGLLPIPVVDEVAASLVRGALVQRIAHRHGLKVDRFAQRILVRSPSTFVSGAPGQVALSALRVAFRKVFLVVNVGLRADDALATFVLGHLFSHYCARVHRQDIDGEWVVEGRAVEVRAAVDAALRGAGSGVLRDVFVGALTSGWRWMRGLPAAVLAFFSGILRRDATSAEESVDELLREETSFFAGVADSAAQGIAAVGDDYLRGVEEAFDRAMAAKTPRQG